jgi:hypothetical protein
MDIETTEEMFDGFQKVNNGIITSADVGSNLKLANTMRAQLTRGIYILQE